MAYEIGSCSGAFDLLDKIKVVALARGWSVNNDSNPTGTTRWLSLQNGTNYYNLLAELSATYGQTVGHFVHMNLAKGFNGGSAWNTQPTTSSHPSYPMYNPKASNLTGPFTSYRIFSGANYIHVAVERTPGVYVFLALGSLDKYGTYVGGAYASASSQYTDVYGTINSIYSSSHAYLFDNFVTDYNNTPASHVVHAEVDGVIYSYNHVPSAGVGTGSRVTGLVRHQSSNNSQSQVEVPNYLSQVVTPNSFNLVTPLQPSILYKSRASGLFSPIGEVPDFRAVNMKNYNAGDEVVLGGDTWVILPAKSKTLTWNVANSMVPSSGMYGYAFKKVI